MKQYSVCILALLIISSCAADEKCEPVYGRYSRRMESHDSSCMHSAYDEVEMSFDMTPENGCVNYVDGTDSYSWANDGWTVHVVGSVTEVDGKQKLTGSLLATVYDDQHNRVCTTTYDLSYTRL